MHSILDWFRDEGIIFKRLVRRISHSGPPRCRSCVGRFRRGLDQSQAAPRGRAAKMVILDADHPDVMSSSVQGKEERKAWALGEAGYDMSLNGEGLAVDPVPERQQLGPRDRRVHEEGPNRRGLEPHRT